MSSKKRAASLRKRLICLALLMSGMPVANAGGNIFSDAWDCAKGSAEAGYELAGKGGKALQVLGQAPQCVAYATAGDAPLYATTGALFTLNAIDSSIVSSTNCVPSVKAHAVVPMARLLDGTFSGVIPKNLLDAGSQEATDQLWQFMATTPPVSQAIDRVECGCTFLEAGISVQNLVEIFTIIAESGAKCDAALSNVPGYQTVKKGVEAGAGAMNNLGEDLFTDQVQHKDIEQYYFEDFDGGVNSYAARSHAAARVLNPSHNWRTQSGAAFLSDTVVKPDGGANTGEQYKQTCVTYFDNHKMSTKNANEVCESMVQRFDHDYKTLVARMANQDIMIKQLDGKLAARAKQAKAECDTQFPPEGAKVISGGLYDGSGLTAGPHNHCITAMQTAGGVFDWRNPYAVVGSLGEPVDPAKIDAILATGKTYYFVPPTKMWGARKMAYDAFENNGGNAGAAVAQGLIAYDLMHDKILKESHAAYDKQVMLAKQQKLAQIKNAAGFAFSLCPTGEKYQACIDALGDAVQVCLIQTATVPISGEFAKPYEQVKIDAIEVQCKAGYGALANALRERASKEVALRNSLSGTCPTSGSGLHANCLSDVQAAISSCQGGAPRMTSGYFISKLLAQDPTPQVSCAIASSLFKSKWAADEEQIARINSGVSTALKACIAKVPHSGDCQQQVGVLADSCRNDLQQTANVLLGGLPLQSTELGNAKDALKENADACIAQMMAIPEKLGYGHEAEALMLAQYGPRCMRDKACEQLLSDTLRQCQGLPPASAAGASGARVANVNSGRGVSATSVVAVDLTHIQAHGQKMATAKSPVTAMMNTPSAFGVGSITKPVLAKSPEQVVAECSDELQAALAKAGYPVASNGAARPAPAKAPVLTTTNAGGARSTQTMPAPAAGGRPLPSATTTTVPRSAAPAPTAPILINRQPAASPTPIVMNRPPAASSAPVVMNRRPAAPATPIVMSRQPAASVPGETVTLEPGMDRMGGDYRGFPLSRPDQEWCRRACADDSACRSFTYVKAGVKGPQAMCFLKNTTPAATANDCCSSGQKVQVGKP